MAALAASVLTQGLDELRSKSSKIDKFVQKLYNLDDKLQLAHQAAKKDEEEGEKVVEMYSSFLAEREILIEELQTSNISIPWQLRMRIDELELTLKSRKRKKELEEKHIENNGVEHQKSKELCSQKISSPTDNTKIVHDPLAPTMNPLFIVFFLFFAMMIALSLQH